MAEYAEAGAEDSFFPDVTPWISPNRLISRGHVSLFSGEPRHD
jgi:hypothetical protein